MGNNTSTAPRLSYANYKGEASPVQCLRTSTEKRQLFDLYDPISLRENPNCRYYGVSLLGSFESFPLELIEYIVSFLDYKDLSVLSQVNWWFNIRAESDIFWRDLYSRYFRGVNLTRVMKSWKSEFRESLLHDDEWSPLQRSKQLCINNGRQIMIEKGYEWSTCQIGCKLVSDYVKKRWTLRVLGTVGLMVGLVDSRWDFVDSYPGTGYYGCTVRMPSPNTESKRANQNLFSLACYEVFDRYDKVEMEVNTIKRRVRFFRNDQLHGQLEYDSARFPSLIPICALCGPSSSLEIISPFKNSNKSSACKEEMLPALSQAHQTRMVISSE